MVQRARPAHSLCQPGDAPWIGITDMPKTRMQSKNSTTYVHTWDNTNVLNNNNNKNKKPVNNNRPTRPSIALPKTPNKNAGSRPTKLKRPANAPLSSNLIKRQNRTVATVALKMKNRFDTTLGDLLFERYAPIVRRLYKMPNDLRAAWWVNYINSLPSGSIVPMRLEDSMELSPHSRYGKTLYIYKTKLVLGYLCKNEKNRHHVPHPPVEVTAICENKVRVKCNYTYYTSFTKRTQSPGVMPLYPAGNTFR